MHTKREKGDEKKRNREERERDKRVSQTHRESEKEPKQERVRDNEPGRTHYKYSQRYIQYASPLPRSLT